MTIRILSLLLCCFLFSNCDDTFLSDLEEQRPLAGIWKSTQLQINSESVVFDMNLTLKEDHTFVMHAYVLGKVHTRYVEHTFTGTWKSLASEDTFELSYDNDYGIIGYYTDTQLEQETYFVEVTSNKLALRSQQNHQHFKLLLER